MAGLYIHIPFCTKKCNYCNFHFSTRLELKSKLIESIGKELFMRKEEMNAIHIETLYFGGGTPSLLSPQELDFLFRKIEENYDISQTTEITLEANPENLSDEYLTFLKEKTPINRLSIGIQSFFDEDLKFMNRTHNSKQAESCIKNAQDKGFENITIDLIYGGQTTTDERWLTNLDKALTLEIPHISSYALTVEPKTAFEFQIRKGKIPPVEEDKQFRHFELLRKILSENGYIQYEFSNFGKKGFFSRHNTSYWKNKTYMGIGPSAHSYDGKNKRSWNVSHNMNYLRSLEKDILPAEEETISEKDRFNERIMLGLRTLWGIDIRELEKEFSHPIINHFHRELANPEVKNKIKITDHILTINPEFLFLTDGIISQFFFVD
ncbi:MAG: radical SAM family heme chaperone HemW [Flavobacteriaceae bacterium]|jgi:oxygen-independent coproporphyrinogen-3 oxidase|nr:radical SAM family heme chaperone HemW [Flavobacteriaceae bacterium]